MIEDLVQDNIQENSSCQGFKNFVDEDGREALDDEQDHVLEDEKREKISDLNHEEYMGSIVQKQSSISVQESSTKFYVVSNFKGKILQVPDVKVQKKSLM